MKPPHGTEHCRRQALDNIIQWHKLEGVNLPHIGVLGFVPHPRKQSLASSLGFVRVLNETVFVAERYIKIKLRRLKYRKSRFLFRQSNRKPSRLSNVKTDKKRHSHLSKASGRRSRCNKGPCPI